MSDSARSAPIGGPRATVCVPTYQGRAKLERTAPALLSVLGSEDQVIWVVDGSSDGSASFLRELGETDGRVHVVEFESNHGRAAAVNAACREARGRVVIRVDDDVIVSDGFVDAHVAAHDASRTPVGCVSAIQDVFDVPPSGMWSAFVDRNRAADRARWAACAEGLPACAWGAVCSVTRDTGQTLGWYDERFSAYGWEDIEFGYRLVGSRVRIVMLDGCEVQHLAEVSSFLDKLRRGFLAGARMGVFAEIHGSGAVLDALGAGGHDVIRPRTTISGIRAAVLAKGKVRAFLAAVARVGEHVLASIRWRRGYDAWVARWLKWSYACGWRDEAESRGLPLIEAPTAWERGVVVTPRQCWDSLLAAWSEGEQRAEVTPILRSAFLRELEHDRVGVGHSWRRAAASVVRLIQAYAGSTGAVASSPVDAVVFFEEVSPSQTEGTARALRVLADTGASLLAVAASERVRAHLRETRGVDACTLESISRAPAGAVLGLPRTLLRAHRSLVDFERTLGGRPWSTPQRLQLVAEIGLAEVLAVRARGSSAIHGAKLVISASEYFPASVALRAAVAGGDTTWVTLQHGAVNWLYAPFTADMYWAWSDEAARALAALEPMSDIRIVGSPQSSALALDTERVVQVKAACGLDAIPRPVICLFSQSHGPEFSAATHYDLAARISRCLDAVPDAVLLLKMHPAEKHSVYAGLAAQDRCHVVPAGVTAVEAAAVSDVAVALGSTALIDAISTECVGVEVRSDESLMAQAVAVERVSIDDLTDLLVELLSDERRLAAARVRQREAASRFIGDRGFSAGVSECIRDLGIGGADAAS